MKRGLADIVTSVLLILIVLSAASAAWVSIQKFVFKGSGNLEGSTDCLSIRLNPIYCNYNPDNGEMTVSVKREPGRGNLEDMLLSFINPSGETQTVYAGEAIDELESATFNLENIDFPLSGILDFAVSAIIGTGTNQRTCESSRTIQCTVSTEGIGPSEGCEYCNDNLVFTTCDIIFAQQGTNTSIDMNQFGMSKEGISIGSSFLGAGSNLNLTQMLSRTYDQLYGQLTSYRDSHPDMNPSGLIILDLENDLGTKEWGAYIDDSETLTQIFIATKLRIDIAREIFPQGKLALYNTPLGSKDNSNIEDANNLLALQRAGEYGVFDNLDYMMPNIYVRYFNHWNNNVAQTYNAMDNAETIRNSLNQNFQIVPLLSGHVAGAGSDGVSLPANPELVAEQISIIQESDWDVKSIAFWGGNDTYGGLNYEQFFRDVKPVPRACFDS